jgi:hypothetical protein
LDPGCSDLLNLRYIGTFFCLINTKICGNEEEGKIKREAEKYTNLYEEERIRREQFINIPMWFDKEEESPTLHSKTNIIFNFRFFI